MFRNLFKKKSETNAVNLTINAEHGSFTIEPWRVSGDAVNGNGFADKAKARGRYEIAEQFHVMGTDWYEKNVVLGEPPEADSDEMVQRFKDCLEEFQEAIPEFSLLTETRKKIISTLNNYPDGIERGDLKKIVGHSGATSWGVICNQLARGGFIQQEQQGKKFLLQSSLHTPVPNEQFLKDEIPAPGTSGMGF